jgi:hypothetical protein
MHKRGSRVHTSAAPFGACVGDQAAACVPGGRLMPLPAISMVLLDPETSEGLATHLRPLEVANAL